MTANDHLRALLGQLSDRGRQPLDPRPVRDLPIAERNVEVGAEQHAPPRDIEAVERAERHAPVRSQSRPNNAAVSPMRLEKPHSLSYQPITRASAPSTTVVWVASKLQDAG